MAKNFYSLGYNLADQFCMSITNLSVNGREYPSENYDEEVLNLTSWWTPSTSTDVSVRLALKRSEIVTDCSLNAQDEIFVSLYSYCSGTKLQHHGQAKLLVSNDIDLDLNIPPFELAEEIDLHAMITVRLDPSIERRLGAPAISNSRLLKKSWKIALAGSRTQANVVLLDFSKDPRTSKAMWNIKISDGYDMDSWLSAQHSSVLRIEVNRNYEDYIEQQQFKILLMTDIVILSLARAIEDDEKLAYLQNDGIAEGSWAQFVKTMYLSVFSIGELGIKQKWQDNQNEIRARVQHQMSENLELK